MRGAACVRLPERAAGISVVCGEASTVDDAARPDSSTARLTRPGSCGGYKAVGSEQELTQRGDCLGGHGLALRALRVVAVAPVGYQPAGQAAVLGCVLDLHFICQSEGRCALVASKGKSSTARRWPPDATEGVLRTRPRTADPCSRGRAYVVADTVMHIEKL
jgi:hypothetical protein